jgi:hypothetical protein
MRDVWTRAYQNEETACKEVLEAAAWRERRDAARAAFQALSPESRQEAAARAAQVARERGEDASIIQCLESKSRDQLQDGAFVVDRRLSFLLTYQGPWGLFRFVADPAPASGAVGPVSVDMVVDQLRRNAQVQALWSDFRGRMLVIADELSASRWSACLELCTDTVGRDPVRVRGRAFFEARSQFRFKGWEKVAFWGMRPHRSQEQVVHAGGRGRSHTSAAHAGHYYCRAPKVGSVFTCGSHEPFKDFPVKVEWVNSHWQAGELSDEQAIHEFVRVKRDVARNVANVREQQRLCRDLDAVAVRKSIQLRLEAQRLRVLRWH